MRPRHLVVALFVATSLSLAGCDAARSPTPPAPPSEPGSAAPVTPSPESSGQSPAASQVPTAEPVPTDELAGFTCDLPVVEPGTVPIANLVEVRVGSHPGFDRVVWEFDQGTPELTLDRAEPPFAHDATGEPIDVEGNSFLRLTMRGGTRQTDDGQSSYDGPTSFAPGFDQLVAVAEGGDFERQSTWYLGLAQEACLRVTLLTDPNRLVIDLEQ